MIRGSYFDGWDDAAQKLRLDLLPQIANFGLNHICQIADFSNPAIDDAFPAAAKANGISILLAPNTGDYAKLNSVYNANSNVIGWDCMDDADIAGLDKTNARIALLKPFIKAGLKSYITVSKGADHSKFANLADMYHVQNYHYREGLKKWSWTAMLEARKQCKGILLHGPSLIKMMPVDFAFKSNPINRWFTIKGEYTPLQYNKCSILAALCAGANGIFYYTLFYGIAEMYGRDINQENYQGILERPDFVEGYKNFHNNVLKKYEDYFDKGTRVPFEDKDNPAIVGATFTLPTGEWIRIEVDTTSETDPTYVIYDSRDKTLQSLFKGPVTPPGTAKVVVTPDGVIVKGLNTTFAAVQQL